MKLSRYAKQQGISYKTAWRWYKAGQLDAYQTPTGTVIARDAHEVQPVTGRIALYARVSSHDQKEEVLGIDLGMKTLATLSDGRTFDNPKALRSNLKRLRRLSRSQSRKLKGSANRKKAQHQLARQHARIANIRRDALHKATSAIVTRTKPDSERPACIVLEDLNVSGMLKNRTLSRAIADVGMYEFKRQLTYKAAYAGIEIKQVSRWFPSSKTCSSCGTVREELMLSERVFVCHDCGYVADRDYNAARVLAAST